jgi:hypothetical protein
MQKSSRLAATTLRGSLFALAIALTACNSNGTASTGTANSVEAKASTVVVASRFAIHRKSPNSAVNVAPTIAGTPTTTVAVGSNYSFIPNAADMNGDALSFSIQNKPSWATFSIATGQLSGVPSAAGTNANIVISVSDGKATSTLTAFTITVTTASATTTANRSAQVSWSVPLTNSDGSALTDLAGFHVYYGTDPSKLTRVDVPGATSVAYTAANLTAGTYYFTVSAYNSSGVESALPTVLSADIS